MTETQTSNSGDTAIKTVDFFVGEQFASGFYDSCKSVQVGATNGYAMDLIGGGAKTYSEFLKFLGDEKDLGSPFQINFPSTAPREITHLDPVPRNCAENDLASRCTCIDCPNVCSALPELPIPGQEPTCHVGLLTCLSFVLILAYSLGVASFLFGYILQATIRKRREKGYERVALSADAASSTLSPSLHAGGLVGAISLSHDQEESVGAPSAEIRPLGRGMSLLDPIGASQPRQYRLNTMLRRGFYRLGLFAASSPFLTFSFVFTVIGLLNLGWRKFDVETDPVRLWVAPDSESKLQKEFFDEHFGPFYRAQQIFVTNVPNPSMGNYNTSINSVYSGVLSYEHLDYWLDVEKDIRALRSHPHGYRLTDVCFKPAGPQGACVVQSIGAWFGNDFGDYGESNWADRVLHCAHSPVDCLPDFQQPLAPQYVIGGVPETSQGTPSYLDAEALVVTYVISDSLDTTERLKAMEWEEALKDYLLDLRERIPLEAGMKIAFSTGVSLEEEISKSSNTDMKIVVLSYLAMFFYVSLTLGNGITGREDGGLVVSLSQWAQNLHLFFTRRAIAQPSAPIDSRTIPHIFPRLPRNLFVNSKFTLGLFGIGLVVLSVSSSVGLFSMIGVKTTLIIAEVIPFLVLAVGVDNVFILVHELDRQNLLHGANASVALQGGSLAMPRSPTQSHQSPFQSTQDSSMDGGSLPSFLSPEERVARTLAKIGPSILLSTVTETVAFALGALVPMPAVRNFALYAAGSVLLNALLQVTVFVSALAIDLQRVEVSID